MTRAARISIVTAQLPLFALGDRTDSWSVRTSGRARRLSVRVYPGGRVEIVVPPGASPTLVQRFIGAHRQWIDERVRAFAGLVSVDTRLPETVVLTAIDRRYAIEYASGKGAPRVQAVSHDRLLITEADAAGHAVAVALRRWLCDLAAFELGQRLAAVSRATDLHYRRLQIRRQRTRWGSCSISGTISLNVCLLFLEPEVVRYLMIHELCHTQHMNHSPRFWDLVANHEPGYRDLDRSLLRGWQRVPWWMFG